MLDALIKISRKDRIMMVSCDGSRFDENECSLMFFQKDLIANPAVAAKLHDSVITQTKIHKANPKLACNVNLFYNMQDAFKQKFVCRGYTPTKCLKKLLLERGLMTIVQAVKKIEELHRHGYFQGGMCNDSILLFVRQDWKKNMMISGDEFFFTEQMAVFLDWSSTCKLAEGNPRIHPKRYYGDLRKSNCTAERLKLLDLDAAMFAFNEYVRQASDLVDEYLIRYEHVQISEYNDGDAMWDHLGNPLRPTKTELEQFKRLIPATYWKVAREVNESSIATVIAKGRTAFKEATESLWILNHGNPSTSL